MGSGPNQGLIALNDEGRPPAGIAVSLKRSITVICAKARNLDKPFSGNCLAFMISYSWIDLR